MIMTVKNYYISFLIFVFLEPHIDDTPKVPILKIKFKPLGPSPSTSLVNTPQQSPVRKSAEQVVAPLKIPRTQPVPSSEQVYVVLCFFSIRFHVLSFSFILVKLNLKLPNKKRQNWK